MTITELAPRNGRRWWLVEDGETLYALVRDSKLRSVAYCCRTCQMYDCRHVRAVQEREKGKDG